MSTGDQLTTLLRDKAASLHCMQISSIALAPVTIKPLITAVLLLCACALAVGAPAKKAGKKKTKQRKVAHAVVTGPLYAQRAEAMQAADEMATRLALDPVWVRQTLGQAMRLPQVIQFILPPPAATPKNWALYRSRFIDDKRISAGKKFWQDNEATLARAQAQTGVPAEIIVGVVGVETIYGQQMGNFRVIDALATLAFDFPSQHPRAPERSAFFKAELEQFLVMTHRTQTDPTRLRGSYAGAMGMPQFMPSSWLKYAVDFDGDGRIDLFTSTADVIGSVANYFKLFNWQPGMPTHYTVSFDPQKLDKDALLAPDILPTFSVASFTAKGAVLQGAALQHAGPLALVELQNGSEPPSYVAGTDNFYAITRYNWSSYYAMAVIDLAEAVTREVKNRP